MKSSDSLPTRGRPRTQDAASRRQVIIESAYRAFVELGFANTSTAEVARRAKVSKRTLYEVFSDKQALFAAVISEHRHLLLDLPRPEDEQCALDESLFRIFRLDVSEEQSLEREAILRLMTRESILFPELSDYLYETRAVSSREMLMDWLQSTASEKNLPLDDAAVYAGMLMDVVFGALMPHRRVADFREKQVIAEHIKRRIQITLRGMGWLPA
ncbi:TetR/AcrR family transcriptional regulator [Pantoea phytobeneficialis]|uniref:Crotonobetainyl-CoA--carnitine CoA-transferase n=1 Tax=Pantoea phytobeneficialis TaxID=2052056 RepID=A0AAP9HAF9_9GAMM|nr:TetR/AcrR family transcriptional regulator [Pantoea phytobeneficialis]MDO6406560.1 helix-turn-helix domain-containing protein [Pantoea phytobeneficialis]QGR09653.1 crotonobetainyl-CoA--carnitine CoA-transferase [Pantoea phytobeneficialis]